ncbi:hypothetical protein WKT22_04078 [Candidatus Lokiarchaeum ossiferum]
MTANDLFLWKILESLDIYNQQIQIIWKDINQQIFASIIRGFSISSLLLFRFDQFEGAFFFF